MPVGRELKENGHGLIKGIIPAFAWKNRETPLETSVRTGIPGSRSEARWNQEAILNDKSVRLEFCTS
jgi:hypothetical protein